MPPRNNPAWDNGHLVVDELEAYVNDPDVCAIAKPSKVYG